MTQPGFFDELARDTAPARHTDPDTSQAAAKMPFRRDSQRHRLLVVYSAVGGFTDEEAATKAGILKGCPWKRCSELREMGMIVPRGITRTSSMGAEQQVCSITQRGKDVLATYES